MNGFSRSCVVVVMLGGTLFWSRWAHGAQPYAGAPRGAVPSPLVANELLWRWDVAPESLDGLDPRGRDRFLGDLSARESRRLTQVAKLQRIDPAGWRRWLDAKERLTPEGLRLIGEEAETPTASPSHAEAVPSSRPLVKAAPASMAAALAAAAPGEDGMRRLFDGEGRHGARAEDGAVVAVLPAPFRGTAAPEHASLRSAPPPQAGENTPAVEATGAAAAGALLKEASPVPRKVYADLPEEPRSVLSYSPVPDSDWLKGDPGSAADDDNPSQGEKRSFWDRLNNEVCDAVQIPRTSLGLDKDGVGAKVTFGRALHKLPTGVRVLVDEAGLTVSAMPGIRLLDLGEGAKLSLGFGVEMKGMSRVIRPVEDKSGCRQVLRILDLRDVKAVLPLKAERFAGMGVGEIWHFPVVLRTDIRPVLKGGNSGLYAAVHFGWSRSGEPNVSLNRLSQDKLRLRMRLDSAEFFDAGGKLAFQVKGTEFGDDIKDALEEKLGNLPGKLLFGAVNDTLKAELGMLWRWGGGRKGVIDFILDPREPAQMRALEGLLAGDISALGSLEGAARLAARVYTGKAVSDEDVRRSARDSSRALGSEESFSGTDRYREKSRSFWLKVPIFGSLDLAWRTRSDRITFLDDTGRKFDIYRARADKDVDLIKFFGVGPFVESDARYSVLAFGGAEGGERSPGPVMVYVAQAALTNQTADSLKELFERVNKITGLVGANGGAANPRTALPVRFEAAPDPKTGLYREGVGAFTLILGEKALRSIGAAGERDVLRAFVNAMDPDSDYRKEMQWVLAHGRIAGGRLEYDEDALAADFGFPAPQDGGLRPDWLGMVRHRGGEALLLARELRRLGTAKAGRAERVRDLIGGQSKSGLSYGYMLRVLVQLADPADVHAELFYRVKGDKALAEYFTLNPGLADMETARQADRALQRFDPPSRFMD